MARSKVRGFLLLVFLANYCPVSLSLKKQENDTYYRLSPQRFGPFYVTSKSLSFCRPAGVVDEEHYLFSTVHVVKISRHEEEYRGYGIVPLDTKVHKFLLDISFLRSGVVTPIYRTETRNPCDDIMFSTFVNFYVMNANRNCIVKKGNYSVHGYNINTLAHLIAGENFIHDTFLSHFEVFSSKGSIFCANNIYETKPLKKKPKS